MKAVILAGGFGSRLSEETHVIPKPLIEIGGKPILWHIMKIYSHYGINDFIVCCGYKGYAIKEYFANYLLHMSDITFDLPNNAMEVHQKYAESWRVTLLDTGEGTMTGGRLKRAKDFIGKETFCMTYGDGVADVDIEACIAYHRSEKVLATVTAVQPPGRFGSVVIDGRRVKHFQEKLEGDGGWINAGFFVLEPSVLDYIEDDQTIWERDPMETLTGKGQVAAFKHKGFWHCMDTLRDKIYLEEIWNSGRAAWNIWQKSEEKICAGKI